MPIEVVKGKDVPESSLPFSPAIKAGDFVFVSGQASVDETGKIVSDTFENEMRRSIENVKKVLAGAGLDLSHVVNVKSYVSSSHFLAEYNKIYREYFTEPLPSRSTIVNCLPDIIKFELDVVAYAGK